MNTELLSLRTAYEGYLNYKGWSASATTSVESVRYAVLGALCCAPEGVNKTELLKVMSKDFALMANVFLRESVSPDNVMATANVEGKASATSNVLSIDDVVAEFGYSKNSLKSKQWRDENGFPYHQLKSNGKVVYYRNEIEQWYAKRNAN